MPDPSGLLDILSNAGLLGGTVILIWLLITERLIPRSRLDEEHDKLAEASRERAVNTTKLDQVIALVTELTRDLKGIADEARRRQ